MADTPSQWVVEWEVTQPFHGPGGAPGEADVVFSPGDRFKSEAAVPDGVTAKPVPVQVKPAAEKTPAKHAAGKD